jgi:hypothetical protein
MPKANLLHIHPELQKRLNLDKHHVIVDRREWIAARKTLASCQKDT